MKSENELILIGIASEIINVKKELSKNEKYYLDQVEKCNVDQIRKFLNDRLELLNNLEKLIDLRRSKKALIGLDDDIESKYDIDLDTNFSKDDIPF